MTAQDIEQYLQVIINPNQIGMPAIMAMMKLKAAIIMGAVIPDAYSYVDESFIKQKRAACIQPIVIEAWKKLQDESCYVENRWMFLNVIEMYKNKGGSLEQILGITENDFNREKIKSEFDKAINEQNIFDKLDQLEPFATDGHMSGQIIEKLFGKEEADKMRDIANQAFTVIAKGAVLPFVIEDEENDLLDAACWREHMISTNTSQMILRA